MLSRLLSWVHGIEKVLQQTEALDKTQWPVVNTIAYTPSTHLSILLFKGQKEPCKRANCFQVSCVPSKSENQRISGRDVALCTKTTIQLQTEKDLSEQEIFGRK